MDILQLLAGSMNFTYTLVEPDDMEYGVFENGTWMRAVGMVQRREADLAVDMYAIDPARYNVIQYLPVMWNSNRIIISHVKTETAFLFLSTFSAAAWCFFFSCVLLVLMCIWLFMKGYMHMYDRQPKSFLDCVYIILVPNGSFWQPSLWGTRLLISGWGIKSNNDG